MTTDLKHTPGPWTSGINDVPYAEHDGIAWTVDAEIGGICMVDGPDEWNEANARLIAAAPELLTELVEARTTLSILRTQVMVEIGRCADPSESRWEGVPEKLKERLDAMDAAITRATGAQS